MGTVTGMIRNTGKGPYRHMRSLWKASLAVAAGDFCFNDSITPDANSSGQNYDKSAGAIAFGAGTHSQAQVAFKAVFRGVSDARRTTLQTSDGDDTTDGPIIATGEFCYPCSSLGSAAQIGSYVGLAQSATGGAQYLAPQQVEIVSNEANAIGRLTEFAPVGSLYLTFEILPYEGITNGVSAVT